MTVTQGKRLHRLDALTNTHMGRMVNVGGLTGILTNLIPVADRVQCALIVGGARVWSEALPGATEVEVWRAET